MRQNDNNSTAECTVHAQTLAMCQCKIFFNQIKNKITYVNFTVYMDSK